MGEMIWILSIYLVFAVAHPISELVGGTNLRMFLNKVYYGTNRDDFPVSRLAGIGGSLLVLLVLIIPLFGLGGDQREPAWIGWDGWKYLALGLALADLIQHAAHVVARPRTLAPRVHLITILGVLFFLLWIIVESGQGFSGIRDLGLLLIGALPIFGNWTLNSLRARGDQLTREARPEQSRVA